MNLFHTENEEQEVLRGCSYQTDEDGSTSKVSIRHGLERFESLSVPD